jgi:hypothetical protein
LSNSSVGSCTAIDDEHGRGQLVAVELQTELLLHRREEATADSERLRSGVAKSGRRQDDKRHLAVIRWGPIINPHCMRPAGRQRWQLAATRRCLSITGCSRWSCGQQGADLAIWAGP